MKKFIVWCENFGEVQDDGIVIESFDCLRAGEEYAERSDVTSADYHFAYNSQNVITVFDIENKKLSNIKITSDCSRTYYSHIVN
jgi:hypothetical protein